MHALERFYERVITNIIDSRKRAYTFILVVFLIFVSSVTLPVTGILKSDFFPQTDQDLFHVSFEAEPGTRLETMAEMVKPVEERLRKEKEIVSFSTQVGALAASTTGAGTSGGNYANITVNLIKKEYGRKETSMVIASRLRNEFSQIKNMKVTVDELKG